MPGTCAERTQQYIERLKISGKYEDLKKKKAESEKLRRQRLKESLNKLSECKRKKFVDNVRAKCRERVKRFREKSKQSNAQLTTLQSESNRNNGPASLLAPQRNFLQSSYKTEAALAKATTKFRKSLPKSPSKKDAIIEKFVNSLRNQIHENVVQNKAKLSKCGKKGIAEELCTEILHFYERDDVSRISPNTKDARFYKNPLTGRKELKQKRYLVLTLKQAHNKFVIENAEQFPDKVPVKLAKFGALRPAHVKLVHATPQAVCLCIYHENFEQCCSVLHKHLPLFPAYGPELKRLLACDDQKRDCWFKSCDICNAKTVEKKIHPEKDETTNRTEKKQITGTVKKLIDYFVSVYKSFLIHSFINRQQRENFAEDLKDVDLQDDECLVQCDFTENWTNESQDEVYNAHWNQKPRLCSLGRSHRSPFY